MKYKIPFAPILILALLTGCLDHFEKMAHSKVDTSILVFGASWLWMYDGVNPASVLLDGETLDPAHFYTFQGKLYFSGVTSHAASPGTYFELYEYDIDSDKVTVRDTNPNNQSAYYLYMTEFQDTLYLKKIDGLVSSGSGIFAQYSVSGQTFNDISEPAGPDVNHASCITKYNDRLYFRGYDDTDSRNELFSYDGTSLDTDILSSQANIEDIIVHNNKLYFSSNNGSTGSIWSYDGTTPDQLYSSWDKSMAPRQCTVYNNRLYFAAGSYSSPDMELWRLNETTGAPEQVADINTGGNALSTESNIYYRSQYRFAVFNNKLFFPAHYNDGTQDAGTELCYYDAATDTVGVVDINPGTGSSSPRYLVTFKDKLYFVSTSGGPDGPGVYVYNGKDTPAILPGTEDVYLYPKDMYVWERHESVF